MDIAVPKRSQTVLAALATGFATAAFGLPTHAGENPTDQPRVVSYGSYTPGYSVTCDGMICEEIMKFLNAPDMSTPYPVSKTSSGTDDKEKFCRNMELAEPESCDMNNPPSTPAFDPDWVGNGCGDGSFKVAFVDAVLDRSLPNYSGSLDNPLPGISFFGSCQTHDMCYGMSPSKGWCDTNFNTDLKSACQSGNGTYLSQCNSLAEGYTLAVELGGTDAHNAAQNERACAAWVKDMEQNGCNE